MTLKEKEQKYRALLHAMQTGVAYRMEYSGSSPETSPKHLRVGVNSSLVSTSALMLALERKGILTREEHLDCEIELLENEVAKYEGDLKEIYGKDIKLK